ncbi:von Willebrand factor A domain-containing protein 7-like [Glandiceps talaboti]
MTYDATLNVVAKFLEDRPRSGSSLKPGDLQNLDPLTSSSLLEAYYGVGEISPKPLEEAIDEIVKANTDVDVNDFADAPSHFNGEEFKKGNDHLLVRIREDILKELRKEHPNYSDARVWTGQYLHTLQDFYSNTNWIEMKGTVPYEDLGRDGVDILPTVKKAACSDCDYTGVDGDCYNNIIVDGEELTSGYRSGQKGSNKNKDKCSHGGPDDSTKDDSAIGGINKESRELLYSPHNILHLNATVAAMMATDNFFLAPDYGLRENVGDEVFMQFFNLQLNSSKSLTFAIDTTGSMRDDIDAVKEEVNRIIDERVGTVNEPANYVLVPFNDPDYGPVYITTNSTLYREWIDSLTATGGGDCPEMSMSGTELAVNHSIPGSDVYVFTDADAKDEYKRDDVADLALKKNIALDYLLTGNCGGYRAASQGQSSDVKIQSSDESSEVEESYFRRKRTLGSYEYLAEVSGGWVVQTTKSQLSEATEIINLSFQGGQASVMILDKTGSGNVVFSSDATMSQIEITVLTSGVSNIPFTLADPTGSTPSDYRTVLNTATELILVVETPMPGEWTLTLHDSRDWHITVNATTTVDFLYSFYTKDDFGRILPLHCSPATGQEVTILVTVTGLEKVSTLTGLVIEDNYGVELDTLTLSTLDSVSYTADTVVPSEDFTLKLEGMDGDSNIFQRVYSSDVIVQSVSLSMDGGANHALDPTGIPFTINFSIHNYGDTTDTYTVSVDDTLGFLMEYEPSDVTVPAKESVDGFMIVAAENGTESGTVSVGTLLVYGMTGATNYIEYKLTVMDYIAEQREFDELRESMTSPTFATDSTTPTMAVTTMSAYDPPTNWYQPVLIGLIVALVIAVCIVLTAFLVSKFYKGKKNAVHPRTTDKSQQTWTLEDFDESKA